MISLEHTADENPAIDRNFDLLRSLVINTGGESLDIRFGADTLVYTASPRSAILTVTHNLGKIPELVLLTGVTSGLGMFVINYVELTRTDTTFDVVGQEASLAVVTLNENFYWLVAG